MNNNNKKVNRQVYNSKSKLPLGNMITTKTDYDIPTFGFKSALLIIVAAIFSTVILPLILGGIGLPFNLVAIITNTFITSYAVAYSRHFIETKKGYGKSFWTTYVIFALSCFIIGFFWISLKTYL